MAKSFTDINTNFDLIGTITGEAKAPKKERAKKTDKAPEKKEAKSSSIVIAPKEPKTRRATLLLKESTYNKLETYTKKYNLSFNDLVNQILEKVKL